MGKEKVLLGVSLALTALLAFGLGGCSNRPEHTGPQPGTTQQVETEYHQEADALLSKEDPEVEEELPTPEGADLDAQSAPDEGAAAAGSSVSRGDQGSSGQSRSSGGSGGSAGSSGASSSSGSSSSSSSSSGGGSAASSGAASSGSGGGSGQTPPPSSAPAQTVPRTITVSIEIEARTAFASDPAAVAGITSNGVILARRNLTLPEGATVRQALDASGVRVNARGAYIAGIGGLSEGDLGPQSGWMYSVNGSFPNASASAQRLSAGDAIAWRYTINNGADLGARR
ncbi:MAG: DUF4430 domain-containing protein [Coriobacteriia bacterium]|nr:DUF4430 domain-containing protein [Coriobacteriia bacterium]MCL2536830.1 DUF4430 domain-containing protein [Coriobacteriia bacterium]